MPDSDNRSSRYDDIILDIRRYVDDAESIFRRKERFDQDQRDFYARTMVLFAMSNRLIDLAKETCLTRRYITEDESIKNKVYFKRLHDYSVIAWEMRQEMINLVNFRNQVSHHFYLVTRDDIEYVYSNLPMYLDFVTIMEKEHERAELLTKRTILIGVALVTLILILLWFFS
ncbi:MAG: hypothetical protein GXY48_02355 [Methanomicrobiales archaeon]|nr:hypothetical protein [Methanomicrobiales archaeon]